MGHDGVNRVSVDDVHPTSEVIFRRGIVLDDAGRIRRSGDGVELASSRKL